MLLLLLLGVRWGFVILVLGGRGGERTSYG